MSDYEAKGHYQNQEVASRYAARFHARLSISNLRAKVVGWGESRSFLRLLNQVVPGEFALDIATGTGRYAELLLERGYKVGGVDISNDMLRYAKERLVKSPQLMFLEQADAENLPLVDNRYDLVTCMRLYHRVPSDTRRRMLEEVKRVGKGQAILFFGLTSPWLERRQTLRSRITPGRLSNPQPLSWMQLNAELGHAGFEILDRAWVLRFLAGGLIVLVGW